jgi:cytochrome P450
MRGQFSAAVHAAASGPPSHRAERKRLLPAFTPDSVSKLEPRTRALCGDLLERLGDDSECVGAIDYAQEIPTRLTARMPGISEHAGEQFRKWIYEFFELGAADSTIVQHVMAEIMAFFDGEIAKRRASPGDDLINYLLDAASMGSRSIRSTSTARCDCCFSQG